MHKAAGAPVLISPDGRSSRLERLFLGAGNHSEDWLQELLFIHPELLPLAQIEPGLGAPVAVAREVVCAHGSIDNLYLTATGGIVLVETKLWRNVQARREVVAQALDYVSSLMTMDYEMFEVAVLRHADPQVKSLHALVADQPEVLDEAAFVDAVSANLARGRILVLAVGDGIRAEAEALAELLQRHAGAHFTFALVELAVWQQSATGDLMIVPNTLAQTVMIKRGVLTFEGPVPLIQPVPDEKRPKAQSMSEEIFFEELAKLDPGLPANVRAFIRMLEPLGVYCDLKAALNFKVDLPDNPRPTNFGYIGKDGRIWTNTFTWTAPEPVAREYNQRLAELIGGRLSTGRELYLTTNGTSAPQISTLLPQHAEAWTKIIESVLGELRRRAEPAT